MNLLWVVEEHPAHELAPFALYKLAWIEYNVGDPAAAADDLALLLEWLNHEQGKAFQTLAGAAQRDLERFDEKLSAGNPE